ncbi:TonB-dependent receptor [Pelomonas sp. CA6]|uniref:TonB-dependent receptor n=1 Tax=Pelomonas sp. CA6 TaxID=2907999 RepID=UPI001F4C4F5C|nr:TonB-dependent receptor [Pelomonas sp. CA6]MCH7344584.1 TonB-dependent receptor [Pelomonas sp. CA6]
MPHHRLGRSHRLLALPALLACAGLHAQTATSSSAAAPADEAKPKLEAVVVSGQGRQQQLQSVPIAIQVMSGEQMRQMGSSNLADAAPHVPGLQIDATQATQPIVMLRGIGTSDFGIGTDSPVGIYVDGVYAGKTGGALLNFNDLKRVEVLKGPQGTLFGRNSAGGAISLVSNDPVFERQLMTQVRLGTEGLRQGQITANTPLGQDLALRVNLVSRHSNGWLRDQTGVRAGGDQSWGARASLLWRASEDTRVILSAEHERLNQRARPALGLVNPLASDPGAPFPADPARFSDPRRASRFATDVSDDRETRDYNGATLRISHDLGWAELQSTTAYRAFDSRNRQDNDGTAHPGLYLSTTNAEHNRSWQQEFRLAGKTGIVDWLGGLSLYREDARQSAYVDSTTTALDLMSANLAGLPLFSTVNALAEGAGVPGISLLGKPWSEVMHNRGRFEAAAVYGDLIWQLTPATRLTTGLRITRDRKRFSWEQPLRSAASLDQDLAVLDAAQLFDGLVAAGAISAEQAALMQAKLRGNALIATSGATPGPLQISRSWSDTSPRLVLDHRLSRELMVYGSLTRGYQAGGFNTLQVNSVYSPERVTSLEIGAKGQQPELGLSWAASFFAYRFDNLQTLQLVPSGSGIPAYQVVVSDQRAEGLDLEARWQAASALQFFGNLEWLNQRYRRGTSSLGQDLKGQPAGAPRLQLSLGAEAHTALWGGQLSARVQASYTSAQRCNDDSYVIGTCLQTPTLRVGEARSRVDARLAWDSADQLWGLALIGTNLADKRYINRIGYEARPLGGAYATLSRPRAVMVEAKARF